MPLLVVAYPKLDPNQFEWIQSHRMKYDTYLFHIIDPHFTIVFPVINKTEYEFIQTVENCASGINKIEFEIKKAALHADPLTGKFLQFLVPEKGYSEIVNIHDKIYAGELKNNLRTDLPFIPHITIGNHDERSSCSLAVEQINSLNLKISGAIDALTIIDFDKDRITPIKTILLA
jgi:2'-5' RNA ligase